MYQILAYNLCLEQVFNVTSEAHAVGELNKEAIVEALLVELEPEDDFLWFARAWDGPDLPCMTMYMLSHARAQTVWSGPVTIYKLSTYQHQQSYVGWLVIIDKEVIR